MPNPDDQTLYKILDEAKTIAIVGASSNPERPSYGIMEMLQDCGYRCIPINPNETEVLGEKAYASLLDVPDTIDIVDVFRRPAQTPDVAAQAAQVGAKTLWLQLGIRNEDAAAAAKKGGLTFIEDLCIAVVHRRLRVPKRAK